MLRCVVCAVCVQWYSTDDQRTYQKHRLTVHGAPGPEPFTVFPVCPQTTARQLLDMVGRAPLTSSQLI